MVSKWSRPSAAAVHEYTRTLHELISETIAETLRESEKSTLVNRVVGNVRSLQGRLHKNLQDLPAAVIGTIGDHDVLAAAFEILQGSSTIPEPEPHIHFYLNKSGFWYLAAEAPPDLDKFALKIRSIGSPVSGEVWILAWGSRYGDNRTKMHARLYAFDGGSVRTVWSQDALHGGEIKVEGDRITVTYYDPAKWGIDPPNLEEYAITGTGLNRVR
ncbi:MAG: hypothetical protein JNK48_27965 [Bryobacterales bacterium]|nr:hypothetical protein [Bryobacterales bacterium]